ncbi:uncharacterized protein TM35_000551340, partial [Trypanosoma theileri]
MNTESKLQAKYNVAVERYQAAKQAEAAAKKEVDEKEALAEETQEGTKEYFLAWAELYKAEIAFTEKVEQRCGAEYEVAFFKVDCVKYRHGADSKEGQRAQHRAELAHTMEYVYRESSPYWIKWYKLDCKAWWVYYQLKAEGYDNSADELDMSRKLFCDRIKANGETLSNARNAVVEALNKWEQEDDRVAWDKAKPEYDSALAKWNEFKIKGDQYAEELGKTINSRIKGVAPISELLCGHTGKSVAELQKEAKQDPHSAIGLELLKKYGAAAKRYEAAVQGEAAAKKERDEKLALAEGTHDGTKEYYLAKAEWLKAEMAIAEKVEQRYATESERNSCYTDWMKYRHGGDSKEAQRAQHRAEVALTMKYVYRESSPYWIKWYKLDCKVWLVYYQLKAEGYDNIADELDRAREVFRNRIKANGEALSNARNAAVEALNKWEQEDDRAAWNKGKPKYDTALAKWNEFKPKGNQYAEELEARVDECLRWKESEKKHRDAFERYVAALRTETVAKREVDEKEALAEGTQDGTKEYYLAKAVYWRAYMAFAEKVDERYAAEYAEAFFKVDCVKYRLGGDSKEAQIAQHRAVVARTREFVYMDDSPYWIKWYKLDCKAWWVYYQLKAEGYDDIADELERARKVFLDRIKANGKTYGITHNIAVEALNKWEQEDDRVAWYMGNRGNDRVAWYMGNEMYSDEPAEWNEFKIKGEPYAEELGKTINSRIKGVAPISELLSLHTGKSVAELQKEAKQDPHSAKDLELLKKYGAAAKRYEAAVQAEADAYNEMDEKWALAKKTQWDTKEYYFAWAEKQKAEIAVLEKVEQRCAAENAVYWRYVDCMKYRHGTDSKEAQIAQHRAELSRTMEFVYSDYCPYWIKWYKLDGKVRWVYYQLKAEGYDNVAAELKRQ